MLEDSTYPGYALECVVCRRLWRRGPRNQFRPDPLAILVELSGPGSTVPDMSDVGLLIITGPRETAAEDTALEAIHARISPVEVWGTDDRACYRMSAGDAARLLPEILAASPSWWRFEIQPWLETRPWLAGDRRSRFRFEPGP